MLKSGTLKDKISTLSVLVDESSIHAVHALDTLMSMAKKKGRDEAIQAIDCLMNLMLESILPNRKLKYFRDQPLNDPKVSDKHLIVWAFEDYIKNYYYELLCVIETLSHDVLIFVRQKIISIIFTLFKEKPEQDQNLMRLLVNKLGDKERKVASKTSYLINQIFEVHPLRRLQIIKEIEQLILFPTANERALYYGVITLNQIIFTKKDTEVANKLIDIYFVLFTKLLELKSKEIRNDKNAKKNKKQSTKKSKEDDKTEHEDIVNSKLVAAILTGVNRAYKFAKVDHNVYESRLNVLYRITCIGTFNISIQALMLIYHISCEGESLSERFYRSLYQSLLDPRLCRSSKHAMYLNLLFKALKDDPKVIRVEAFIKRLIQICGHHLPPFICGAFYMISELIKKHPSLNYFINHPEDRDDDEHSVDVSDDDSDLDRGDKFKHSQSSSQINSRKYDGRKRDPQYSNADKTCIWELTVFTNHFHPTVALYAKQLLENISIDPPPELHHHTLSHFLDRFVYRNPKKTDRIKGGNPLLQPTVASEPGMVIMKKGTGISKDEINVNSEEFWRKRLDDVPEDQIFFHKYFTQKNEGKQMKKMKKESDKTTDFLDNDQDEDDELEDEIWAAMKSTMPVKLDSDLEDNGPAHKKVKLKHLPTFASYEDIVSLINKKKRKSSRRT
ncbi:CBF/Mak21 family-domain-containing protein [Gigaspora rosea]|uniref:CBF/Mak21 family-domain-containing protein n=1 Tax=Gigaspora rosea TaxID=44941 RepID=A0A397U4H8_9GLOM|nr:CBF/Mak21 family-domain-containing protein [Gigaspora rosea]